MYMKMLNKDSRNTQQTETKAQPKFSVTVENMRTQSGALLAIILK